MQVPGYTIVHGMGDNLNLLPFRGTCYFDNIWYSENRGLNGEAKTNHIFITLAFR